MAHRTPKLVETHGDAKRLANAVASFVIELTVDRRVLADYDRWRAVHTVLDREFEHLLATHPATIEVFIADVYAQDTAATVPLVRTLLQRVPEAWVHMVTRELLRAFRTAHYTGRTRADRPPSSPQSPQFGVRVQLPPTHPRGKVPHDPYKGQRGIRWLYRHYVQDPGESVHALAREYASWANREDPEDCIRDVKDGMRQAWTLLDLAARSDWAQPGRIIVPKK